MTSPSNRLRRLLAACAAIFLISALYSCNLSGESGHTYMTVHYDTAWTRFDMLEISWIDPASGAGGLLFEGKPEDLKDVNKFEADGYKGQKIEILFKGYIGIALAYEEHRGFDGANPGTVTKRIVPIDSVIPIGPGPNGGTAKTRPPRLSPIKADTLVSILDSVSFLANATLDSGTLKACAWDYDGDGVADDSSTLSGASAILKASHSFSAPGIYNTTLLVYSNSDSMSVSKVKVVVLKDDPIVDAGGDRTVYPGDTLTLAGTAKDGRGRIVRMEWKIGSAAFEDAPDGVFALTAPETPGDLDVRFRATDDDSQTVEDGAVIHVISRSESNLTGISVSAGKLSPQFNPAILDFSDTVEYDVASISITPTGAGAITVNNSPIESGKPSAGIDLKVGTNTITLTVKLPASLGKTYQVNIFRMPASTDANLYGLILSAGALDASFSPEDSLYSVSVPNGTTTTTVTATLANPGSKLTINGFNVGSGVESGLISLKVGANQILIEVTSQGGDKKRYHIDVDRAEDGNAELTGLGLSAGAIAPSFTTGVTEYVLNVDNAVAGTQVTATAARATSTISINGQAVPSGNPASVNLVVGANPISVKVTAQNGFENTYNIRVIRAGNGNAELSGLVLSAGAIVSAFTPEAVFYSLEVPYGTASTTVTATVAKESSTLTINGQPETSGKAFPVDLAVGSNPITISVTAQSGDKKAYTVIVTRGKNPNVDLMGLEVSAGAIAPVFAAGTLAYTLSVGNDVNATTVTPLAAATTSEITVNGTKVASGAASPAIPLAVGDNPVSILVTAQSGGTKTYSLVVTRALNSDVSLSALSISAGALTPVFAPGTLSYAVSVANSVLTTSVTAIVATATSSVKVNGVAVASGTPSGAISLNVGANTITVLAAAQDKSTRTYSVTVTRLANANADLSALAVSTGALTPVFASGTIVYSISVANTVTTTTLTPTVSAGTSTVKVNGTAVASGAASQAISLNVSANAIPVVVTAQNNSVKTYTVTMTRAGNGNADLSGLSVSAGTIAPVFNSVTTAYTLSVANSVVSTTVTPTLSAGTSTVKVNGTAVASGAASGAIPFIVGANILTVLCTAQDNTVKTYSITVTRAPNANPDLSGLSASAGSITPSFAVGTTAYAMTVPYGKTSTTVTPTAAAGVSSIKVNGVIVASGSASGSIALSVGVTSIPVQVTAESGIQNTYTIQVTRNPGARVGAGANHTLFVKADGTLLTAGWNQWGALGDGSNENRSTPVPIMTGVADVSGGYYHSVIVKADGAVLTTGGNWYGTLGEGTIGAGTHRNSPAQIGTGATNTGSGYGHTVLLKGNGSVWTWGFNFSGQLGNGKFGQGEVESTPAQITTGYSAVACGGNHTLFLKSDGVLFGTGHNTWGQLGDGSTTDKEVPVQVMTDVAKVSAGNAFTLFLKKDGTLWGAGLNTSGNLGDGSNTDKTEPVKIMSDVADMAAGSGHSLIVKKDGTLWATGSNSHGQLGDGSLSDRNTPFQVLVGAFSVAAGERTSFVVKTDGSMWAIGANGYGQLGDGSTEDRTTPVKVFNP